MRIIRHKEYYSVSSRLICVSLFFELTATVDHSNGNEDVTIL